MHDISALDDIQLLTVAEVASVLRVSKMTVYRLIRSGDLAHKPVGTSYRVPVDAVRRFLEGPAADGGDGESPAG